MKTYGIISAEFLKTVKMNKSLPLSIIKVMDCEIPFNYSLSDSLYTKPDILLPENNDFMTKLHQR